MQKLCCVRTRQHPLPVWSHNLSLTNLLISPSIVNHFRWELYQRSWVISQFSGLVFPPFLVLLLSTDCQKCTFPQVGMSKFCLPLENLVQNLCFTFLHFCSGKETFGFWGIVGVYPNIIPMTPNILWDPLVPLIRKIQSGLVKISVGPCFPCLMMKNVA